VNKYAIPKNELEELYLNQKLMLDDIAQKYSVSQPLVSYLITRYKIPRRERRKYRPDFTPSPEMSYAIGVILGDGHISRKLTEHNLIQLSVTDKDFAEKFAQSIAKVVGRSKPYTTTVYRHFRDNTTYYRVNCSSREAHNFFNTGRGTLLRIAAKYPADFIRGFFDAEGGVSFFRDSKRFVVFATNTDKSLLRFSQKLLMKQFSIPSKIKLTSRKGRTSIMPDGHKLIQKRDAYQLLISGEQNVDRYYEHIGFSIKRKQIATSILQIDIDRRIDQWGWLKFYEKAIGEVLAAFKYKLKKFIAKPSPTNTGLHLWLHIKGKPLNEETKNLLQALCYDDLTRVHINRMRIDRDLKQFWSKLFVRHLWTKPLPKCCQRCKLREILNEMREAYVVQAAEKQNL
jgi:hypothetical protein